MIASFPFYSKQISTEGSEEEWFNLATGTFCVESARSPRARKSSPSAGLATCPRFVQGLRDGKQKIKGKPDDSLNTEEDPAAFKVRLLQNHLMPGMVTGKSMLESQYCK